MRIHVLQHVDFEHEAGIGRWAEKRLHSVRRSRLYAGETLPQLADFDMLAIMGGPMSVNDPLPWIPRALNLIREAYALNRPILGHCLGGQLISKALGGVVTRNPVKEIGWLPVTRVDGPFTQDWLGDLPDAFNVFHWHGETFTIPDGATRILSSRDCPNQAFVIGNTLAMQCHVEMTADMVRLWARTGAAEIAAARAMPKAQTGHPCPAPLASIPSPTVQDEAAMTQDLDNRVARLTPIAHRLYRRWLQGLDR